MQPRPALLASVVVLFVLAGPSHAADLRLTAGVAAVEITPDTAMINWVTKKPFEEVGDPLFVRALVLSDGTARVALLAFDLVETREATTADVRAAILKEVGIPGDHVLLNASHSHSAPCSPLGDEELVPLEKALWHPQTENDVYRAWAKQLIERCVEAVKRADAARRPATLGLARAWAGDVLFNRRPVAADGQVKTTLLPANPYALPEGLRFGPVDPTLTWLSVRDESGKPLAAAYHLPAHAVAVYGEFRGISADWSGASTQRIVKKLGAETLFLQGCSGDIVPRRRGLKATREMADIVAERALAAEANRHELPASRLRGRREQVALPLHVRWKGTTQTEVKRTEVQLLTYGSLAIVALPGEPLTRLGQAIQDRSPYPHTLVLGYSNGSGVQYVGLPGEKARGGYEMGEWGLGGDEAGRILIEAAAKLLDEAAKDASPAR